MFYVLGSTINDEFTDFDWDAHPDALRLFAGKDLGDFRSPLSVVSTMRLFRRLKRVDVMPMGAPFIGVSEALKDLLIRECPDCVQFFPLPIYNKQGRCLSDNSFWALNITRSYPAIDLGQSDYSSVPRLDDPSKKQITFFKKIVIRSRADDAPMIFREANDLAFAVIRQELKECIERHGLVVGMFPLVNMA